MITQTLKDPKEFSSKSFEKAKKAQKRDFQK